jgi:poly(hydroxyalkanoate) granule-associated protein
LESIATAETGGVKVAKEDVVVTEDEERAGRNPLLEMARKMRLVGMGAASLAQEQVEDFMGALLERGESVEKEGRDMVREVVDWQRDQIRQVVDRRKKPASADEGAMASKIEEVLEGKDVPAKSDLEALQAQIAELTAKLDELKKEQAGE